MLHRHAESEANISRRVYIANGRSAAARCNGTSRSLPQTSRAHEKAPAPTRELPRSSIGWCRATGPTSSSFAASRSTAWCSARNPRHFEGCLRRTPGGYKAARTHIPTQAPAPLEYLIRSFSTHTRFIAPRPSSLRHTPRPAHTLQYPNPLIHQQCAPTPSFPSCSSSPPVVRMILDRASSLREC